MRRIVLIIGEPGQGKSYLARKLGKKFGAEIVSLDSEYVQFIRGQYPSLDLDDIACVISQHYKTVLTVKKRGHTEWKKHVIALIKEKSRTSPFLVVEGYLLSPILEEVLKKTPKRAKISVVYVRAMRYYISGEFEDIAGIA